MQGFSYGMSADNYLRTTGSRAAGATNVAAAGALGLVAAVVAEWRGAVAAVDLGITCRYCRGGA